jgi:hypothetical protein
MKIFLIFFILCYFLNGCVSSKYGSKRKDENLSIDTIQFKNKKEIINFKDLKDQKAPALALRGARGIISISPVTNSLVSLASNALKKVISNEQKKYTASYQFGINDLFFYDQLSTESAFDPTGLNFNGFSITRTFKNKNKIDTALTASFIIDTSNVYDIINNSTFRLRLQKLDLNFAKAKVAKMQKNKINIDIEISFVTSYINQTGTFYENVTLGKFYLLLRNAPLDSLDKNYKTYYDKLNGKLLNGKSFIVPRSTGYHKDGGEFLRSFSQGNYSIIVKVKECSKDVFINKLIIDNANLIIDATKEKAVKRINKKIPVDLQ